MSVQCLFVQIVRDGESENYYFFFAEDGSFSYELFPLSVEERTQLEAFIRGFLFIPVEMPIIFIV